MSETALKNLSLKEEFVNRFIANSGIKTDCVYQRLRITYDYTKHERLDAVVITSRGIHLFEIITWSGRYRKESDVYWVREERVDSPPSTDTTTSATNNSTSNNNGPMPVTVMVTKVTNPILDGIRKRKALVQYLESILGAGYVKESSISLHVLIIKEECILSEDCLSDRRLVPYSQLDSFCESFKTTWARWFVEWYPRWPVWISHYTTLKNTLGLIPQWEVVHLASGTKLYGELRTCTGVPYDRQSTCAIRFKTTKAGIIYGRNSVIAEPISRSSSTVSSKEELPIDSVMEFLCVDADTPTVIKLTDIHHVTISRPL